MEEGERAASLYRMGRKAGMTDEAIQSIVDNDRKLIAERMSVNAHFRLLPLSPDGLNRWMKGAP